MENVDARMHSNILEMNVDINKLFTEHNAAINSSLKKLEVAAVTMNEVVIQIVKSPISNTTQLRGDTINQKFLNKYEPPTFDGSQNPVRFMGELERNFSVFNPGANQFHFILGKCFKFSAQDWWRLFGPQITNLQEFKLLFINRYWNEESLHRVEKN